MSYLLRLASVLGLATLGVFALSVAPAQAQNLVLNPGFETGDFTGWNAVPATDFSNFGVDSAMAGPYQAASGAYYAFFGNPASEYDSISQTIATTPGERYTLTFELAAPTPGNNSFIASWDSTQVLNLTPSTVASAYLNYKYDMVVAGTSTTITFEGFDGPDYFYLDDVTLSKWTAPEPASAGLLALGVLPLLARRLRRK